MKPICVLRLSLLCIVLSLSQKPISATDANSLSFLELNQLEDDSYLAEVKDEDESSQDSNPHRQKRQTVLNDDHLWPNATIPYVLTEYIQRNKALFLPYFYSSIYHWQQRTCIKFVEYDNSPEVRSELESRGRYVVIDGQANSNTAVGRSGKTGPQEFTIGVGTVERRYIMQLLAHLVGLYLQHVRYDRDNHVIILWANILEGYKYFFKKETSMRLLAPYDVSSIMHVALKVGSGKKAMTIRVIDSELEYLATISDNRTDLSFYDGYIVNTLYNCSAHCDNRAPKCLNSGYLSKDCKCVCPSILTGPTCDQVSTDPGCGGVLEIGDGVTITSPNYPNSFPNSTNCVWLLKSSPGTVIHLHLEDIDMLREGGRSCAGSLYIFYHHIGIYNPTRICSLKSMKLKRNLLQSESNRLVFRFFSSHKEITGRGFNVTAKTVQIKNCASNPCLRGARCRDLPEMETYLCDCPNGWVGQNCDIESSVEVDGQWSEWSAWSGCVGQCGREERSRQCNKSTTGGKDCPGQKEETRWCKKEGVCEGLFYCDFGKFPAPDDCGLIQANGSSDGGIWMLHAGPTKVTENWDPKRGHTTGEPDDAYIYTVVTSNVQRLWLPGNVSSPGPYCFQFHYHLHTGQLRALHQRTKDSTVTIWQHSSSGMDDRWYKANINIILNNTETIGFEANHAHDYVFAIDDVSISPGRCAGNFSFPGDPSRNVCNYNGRRYGTGEFIHVDQCERSECFCNQDGMADCPYRKRITFKLPICKDGRQY